MFKNLFNKVMRKPPDSFDQVKMMVTRKLPIPGLEGTRVFVAFNAKRNKEGFWEIGSMTDLQNITSGFQLVQEAFKQAVLRHSNKAWRDGQAFNFDTAYLILREMEESLFKHAGMTVSGGEPKNHFMAAYRLCHQQFQQALDDTFNGRLGKGGNGVLPSKIAQPQPAAKNPEDPKPN